MMTARFHVGVLVVVMIDARRLEMPRRSSGRTHNRHRAKNRFRQDTLKHRQSQQKGCWALPQPLTYVGVRALLAYGKGQQARLSAVNGTDSKSRP
jgi:hypothetical protein